MNQWISTINQLLLLLLAVLPELNNPHVQITTNAMEYGEILTDFLVN